MVPFGMFLCSVIVKTPQPVSKTFKGYSSSGVPMDGGEEVWDVQYASTADEVAAIVWFIVGMAAGVAFAGLLYLFARYVAEPIMGWIDRRYGSDSGKGAWLCLGIIAAIVLFYIATCAGMLVASTEAEEKNVWLIDDAGVYHRVDRNEYEYYRSKTQNAIKKPDTKATEATTEEPKKTPVERDYPSNDLEYYIDHPDEPMPQEMVNELMQPEDYDPGMDY